MSAQAGSSATLAKCGRSRGVRACRPSMRMPSRSRSSFSRTMAATTDRVGARNAYTSSRLKASAAAPAPGGMQMLTQTAKKSIKVKTTYEAPGRAMLMLSRPYQ